MAGELVERNTLITILCRLTTKPGRDHRSGQEFVVAGSSQETVDALRQAAVILRRDNSRIEALERENATLRAERGEARKAAIDQAVQVALDHAEGAIRLSKLADADGDNESSRVHVNDAFAIRAIAAAIRNMGGEG